MMGNLALNWLNDFTLALASDRKIIVNSIKNADSLNDFTIKESVLCLMF